MRSFLRFLAQDRIRILTPHQHRTALALLAEPGRMLGAWQKKLGRNLAGELMMPRASIFGGSWLNDDNVGSRYANVASSWPDNSNDNIGARCRADHL